MQYRNLGRSGLRVSEVSLGSWLTFGSAVDSEASVKLIRREPDPVIIKIVDLPDRAQAALAILDEMVSEGLITVTDTHVVKYTAGTGE